MSEIKDLMNRYVHFCDECSKAYDLSCSGYDAMRCESVKQGILDEIKAITAQEEATEDMTYVIDDKVCIRSDKYE